MALAVRTVEADTSFGLDDPNAFSAERKMMDGDLKSSRALDDVPPGAATERLAHVIAEPPRDALLTTSSAMSRHLNTGLRGFFC